MRAQTQSVRFFALVADPHFQKVGRENTAFEQKGVIFSQMVQGLVQAARHLRHLSQFGWGQFIHVLVHRLAGINFVDHSVQARHQQGCVT